MTHRHLIKSTTTLVLILGLWGCNQQSAEEPSAQQQSAGEQSASAADAGSAPATSPLPRTASPAAARVFFISPVDGDTVSNPVAVEFGIEGMNVVRAGVKEAHSGHHHLIIDAGLPDTSLPIPADDYYIHFGDASTSTALTLDPGTHTLQLLLGDHLHIPHDPPVISARITVTVE